MTETDRMNIRRRAADIDDQHVAPAIFFGRPVSAQPETFEDGHWRRQNHVDELFDLIETFGASDALHEQLANLFARRFHFENSHFRHHVADAPDLFAVL